MNTHPAYKPLLVIALIYFLTAIIGLVASNSLDNQIEQLRDSQTAAELRGYKNRSVACTDIIHDQEISLTTECIDPSVAVFYPPDICNKIPAANRPSNCGEQTVVVVPNP